jgi:hypothetical protein
MVICISLPIVSVTISFIKKRLSDLSSSSIQKATQFFQVNNFLHNKKKLVRNVTMNIDKDF